MKLPTNVEQSKPIPTWLKAKTPLWAHLTHLCGSLRTAGERCLWDRPWMSDGSFIFWIPVFICCFFWLPCLSCFLWWIWSLFFILFNLIALLMWIYLFIWIHHVSMSLLYSSPRHSDVLYWPKECEKNVAFMAKFHIHNWTTLPSYQELSALPSISGDLIFSIISLSLDDYPQLWLLLEQLSWKKICQA